MSNKSIYIEALASLGRPATVREVHEQALFLNKGLRGDRTSARQSLDRHVALGRARKTPQGYEITHEGEIQSVAVLQTKLVMAWNEISDLREKLAKLGG